MSKFGKVGFDPETLGAHLDLAHALGRHAELVG
jgi:hypothetical protein